MSDADNLEKAYQAATNDAILVDRSQLGLLKISGESRLDLLNRMSTQAVEGLDSGEGTATVLTTDIGRIIDRLILLVSSEAVYAITGENHADSVARYLMRFVFFNDDFHMEDLSAETVTFGVYGAKAAERLADAGFPEVDLPLHHWREVELDGLTAYLARTDPVAGDGYFVMGDNEVREQLQQRLVEAGIEPVSAEAFEALRIEHGLPRFGHELTQAYIPLEANLWDDVSFKKGCYIGQEIIARMESRGRLAKKLVRLRPEEPVAAGDELQAGGRLAGVITSAAVGPHGPVALGYVKTGVLEEKARLAVDGVGVEVVK